MERNYPKGTDGDKENAILAACGRKFKGVVHEFHLESMCTSYRLSPKAIFLEIKL
jgi:hypothetical protein